MSLKEHAEKVLRELGLTFSQAKLYVALLKFSDAATVNAISAFSDMARQDVYRLMEELQEIGLVERVVAKPAKFKAAPMANATSLLMEKRRDRTRELIEQATAILADFPEQSPKVMPQEKHQFLIIPKGEALVRRVEKAIKTADVKIQVINPWKETIQWLFKLHEYFQEAVERDVKIFWITECQHQNPDSNADIVDSFTQMPGFRLRTVATPVSMKMSIFDSTEVFMATHIGKHVAESPALWTDSPMMLELLKDFFDMKWKMAAEYEPQEHWCQAEK
jgi:sugar-specific transcriptional regulator TrmB